VAADKEAPMKKFLMTLTAIAFMASGTAVFAAAPAEKDTKAAKSADKPAKEEKSAPAPKAEEKPAGDAKAKK
jgi:hypothetical protein